MSSIFSAACTARRKSRLSVGGIEVFGNRDLDPPVGQRQQGDVLVVLEGGDGFRRHVFDPLQLAGLQACDAGAGLGHNAEGDGVEARLLVAAEAGALGEVRVGRVVLIALQFHRTSRRELHELPRAGADRLELLRRVVLLLGGHDHDGNAERADLQDEGRLRPLHVDDEGGRVGRLPARHVVEHVPRQSDLVVAVERGQHVGGRHLLAVLERDARPQLEGVGEMIGAFGVAVGEIDDRVVVLVARHQRLEDVHRDVARRDRGRRHLVEAVDVRFLAEHEMPAHMRALEGRRGNGWNRAQCQARGRDRSRQIRPAHPTPLHFHRSEHSPGACRRGQVLAADLPQAVTHGRSTRPTNPVPARRRRGFARDCG